MKIYVNRSVLTLTGFMAFVSLTLFLVFLIFFDTITSYNSFIDIGIGVFLALIFLSQAIALFNFWKKPTLIIDHEAVYFQRFPAGLKKVPRADITSIEKKYLGISQVLEFKYNYQGKPCHTLLTATLPDQTKILSELGLAR